MKIKNINHEILSKVLTALCPQTNNSEADLRVVEYLSISRFDNNNNASVFLLRRLHPSEGE